MAKTTPVKRRGRPKAQDAPASVEQILDAALRAFARYGYDGVSVRDLNRELEVSHNMINVRFGSKEALWYAAVDRGFGGLVNALGTSFDPTLTDPLDQLNHALRRFLEYSAEHPELLALMNIEGALDTPRLDYVLDNYFRPAVAPLVRLLEYLIDNGRIRPISPRALLFLVAHGAGAPFTLVALARRLDDRDPLDPAEVKAHAALTADVITAGLRLDPADETAVAKGPKAPAGRGRRRA